LPPLVSPKPADRVGTLRGVFDALGPGGHLVFESRDPAFGAWREWNRAASHRVVEICGVGRIEYWVEVTDDNGQVVSFGSYFLFASGEMLLRSDSTLRFRRRDEIDAALLACGYEVIDVREAPDRPGRGFVFLAWRPR
jgi:hypothetical protein